MANQIQSCFERYEKKYMLTPAQLRVMLTGMKACLLYTSPSPRDNV